MAVRRPTRIVTSKGGHFVLDSSKDRARVFNEDADPVNDIGKTDDGTYGLDVVIGGVAVGLTTVGSNITQTITITVTPVDDVAPIVSSWDDTFYKDSIASGNEYEVFQQGGGHAWNGLTKSQYDVNVFNSWGLTNNINVKHVAMFKNRSGSSVDTLYVGQMRAISLGSSAS